MQAKLVFLSGARAGQQLEIGDTPISFGRSPECSVAYPSGQVLVSAEHATVTREGDDYELIDSESRNGTFVNKKKITRALLKNGDIIEFGPGGPTVQFSSHSPVELHQTLDASSQSLSDIYRIARSRTERADTGTFEKPLHLSREFVSLAYQKSSRRARAISLLIGAVSLMSMAGLVYWNLQTRSAFEAALNGLSMALEAERDSRTGLASELAAIESSNDSLQRLFLTAAATEPTEPLGRAVTRNFSAGVPLLLYAYGFREQSTGQMLRYSLDANGRVRETTIPDGTSVPQLIFGGNGPIVEKTGSASGFLIDSAGWIVTNKHVAVPWTDDADLADMRSNGIEVNPVLTLLRAHFPPGSRPYPLVVDRVSEDHDLALLRSLVPGIEATPLKLSMRDTDLGPGDPIVLIGYPTGVHNLMFRVATAEREEISNTVGEAASPITLAGELANRGLIQPLVTSGSITDTTLDEVIHSAESTGGSSGGPIVGQSQEVVAVHYAFVTSPVEGDPFRTQRGVQIQFVWDLLPNALARRLSEQQ